MRIDLLLLAILPIIILGLYIYNKDIEKEPKLLLFKLFGSGVLSSIFVFLLSYVISEVFISFDIDLNKIDYFNYFIYSFIFVALIEEGCKWLSTRFIGYNSKYFDESFDIIVYSSFVALGFAFLENIMYVFNYGVSAAILRALISVPGHLSFGIMMGYYMLLSKLSKNKTKKRKYMIYSFLFPFLLHGLYDYLLLLKNTYVLIILFILLFMFFVFNYIKVREVIENNKKISN